MSLTATEAVAVVRSKLWPLLVKERKRVARIDRWMRWDHEEPHSPRQATREYKQLRDRAQAPWGRRVVTAVTDQLYVEGYRAAKSSEEAGPWKYWQQNGFDARQIAIHEAAIGYGLAYGIALPGKSWLGEKMPVMRALDPSEAVAVYEDPAWDDWPAYAMRAIPFRVGDRQSWKLRVFDEEKIHHIVATESGDSFSYVEEKIHGIGVCPWVRYTNHLDLRGRADGDIEPIIPLLGRIDQTTFDRLVVQRFAAWIVRWISGMAPPEQLEGETQEQWRQRTKVTLRAEDLLVADDPDTKFGSLPATSLDGFIVAHDADVRALAAVSQSPAHELLGNMANLSAEALAAAEASLTRRVVRVKHPIGEAHEQLLRLGAKIMGDDESAADSASQVHWADMESRSLAQAADALGKLATMLGVPAEMLWEKIPGWTQEDVNRAKAEAEKGGALDQLVRQLAQAQTSPAS